MTQNVLVNLATFIKIKRILVLSFSNIYFFYLVKILEKRHIMKENKTQYVKRERDLMSNLDHPFFVKLYFTFQDDEKLCILLTSAIHRSKLYVF